jgi:excisionase family DNA binding protein
MHTEPLATTEQAAKYLKVSPGTLRNWRAAGSGPPSYRVGNTVRYHMGEVRAWVREQRVPGPNEAPETVAPKSAEQVIDQLAEAYDHRTDLPLLQAGGMLVGLLREVVACDHEFFRPIDGEDWDGPLECAQCAAPASLLQLLGLEATLPYCGHTIVGAGWATLAEHVHALATEDENGREIWPCEPATPEVAPLSAA